MRTAKRIHNVIGAAACLLVAACGSTVSTAGAPIGTDAGLSAPGPSLGEQPGATELGVPEPAGGAPGTAVPGGVPLVQSPGTVPGQSPNPGRSVENTVTAGGVDGPGVTRTTLRFGVTYTTDSGEANSAAGANNIDPGDVRNYFNAVVDDVNREGGIAGRRVVASYFKTSDTSGASASAQQQAACEHWTQDDRVLVVLDANSELLRSCAEKHGMAALATGGGNAVAATFRNYQHYTEVAGIAIDRYLAETARGLAATDYYGDKPVIGVITWDDNNYRSAVERSLAPALRELGHSIEETSYVRVAENLSAAGNSSADVSAAVLRFRQNGVTHVFIADGPAGAFGGTGLTLLFIKAASSQGYVPRYGMNDNNSAQAGLDAQLWQPEDVKGSRVVTWSNIDDASDKGVGTNKQRRACLDLMRRRGLTPGNINQQVFMIKACDYVWFLRAAIGNGTTVNRDTFISGVAALGARYQSPLAYRLLFAPNQRDGVAGLRRQALDDGCGCYRYTSGIYATRAQ